MCDCGGARVSHHQANYTHNSTHLDSTIQNKNSQPQSAYCPIAVSFCHQHTVQLQSISVISILSNCSQFLSKANIPTTEVNSRHFSSSSSNSNPSNRAGYLRQLLRQRVKTKLWCCLLPCRFMHCGNFILKPISIK